MTLLLIFKAGLSSFFRRLACFCFSSLFRRISAFAFALMYRRNNSAPKQDPCDAPIAILPVAMIESAPLALLEEYDLNQNNL